MIALIFDADDTLWENNIYFEKAFDQFCDFLNHSRLTATQVREVLNEIESVNAKIHGYGSRNFGRNLQQAYRHLAEREIRPDDLLHVMSLAERILEQPVELIEGVEETLAELASRHTLTLFTKGHPEEQRLKIDRSGLARYFAHTEIVKEKDVFAYRRLAEERFFDPPATWMIGNSPKSDINPALEAGLNAVLIPHPHTWMLENQDLRGASGGRFIQIRRFTELRRYF
ncbi:MAG TPA: HAD family hydrolase [Bryobacteraceae bacterium]|jgi:putative hydrolase of the HAD superfamily|nr:HAD family hydrolase [Bryobacteraceae bacterium]